MAEYSFHTPSPVELEVRVPAGDIEIETIEGDESTVVLEGSERLIEQTRVELVGNRLRVELEGGNGPFGITIAIGDWSIGRQQLTVRARVPHSSRAQVATAAADMNLRGRFSELETNSASGDLTVEGEVEGDAEVKTVSGDVRLDTVGRDLTAQSVSADISVTFVGGDVTVKSVSGDVRVESAREGRVTVQSVSGDITLGVAPGTNLDVDAGSVSGDLSSEVPLGADAGTVGEGPTLVVRGKTVSGDFKVFRAA
jgi:putative adhesin